MKYVIITTIFVFCILVLNNNTIKRDKEVEIQAVSISAIEARSILTQEEEEIPLADVTTKYIKEHRHIIEEAQRKANNYTLKPFEVTNLTEVQFNKILRGTGLEGNGSAYKEMEDTYGVNGIYAISVAFLESGYGRQTIRKNNFYGMRGKNGWMNFETPEDNILYFGELMNRKTYKDKSIENIAKVYCPPTHESWVKKVTGIMNLNFDKL